MDYFKTNKFQSKYENVLYVAKILYFLMKTPINTEKLIKKYEKEIGISLTEEYEQIVMMALCFLYSVDLIDIKNNKIERKTKNEIC
jgi:hypothetical protein